MNNVLKFRQRDYELPDDLITVSEFLKKHKNRCSKSFVYNLKYNGAVQFYKFGYEKFSERAALEAMGV